MSRKTSTSLGLAIVLSVFLMAGSAFAYCAAPSQVLGASQRLQIQTDRLQAVAREDAGYSDFSDSVHQLALSINQMQNDLSTGISCNQVRDHFRDVSDNYRHVSDMLMRNYAYNQDPRIMNSWNHVQNAFNDTQQAVYAGPDNGEHSGNGGIYIHIPGLGTD